MTSPRWWPASITVNPNRTANCWWPCNQPLIATLDHRWCNYLPGLFGVMWSIQVSSNRYYVLAIMTAKWGSPAQSMIDGEGLHYLTSRTCRYGPVRQIVGYPNVLQREGYHPTWSRIPGIHWQRETFQEPFSRFSDLPTSTIFLGWHPLETSPWSISFYWDFALFSGVCCLWNVMISRSGNWYTVHLFFIMVRGFLPNCYSTRSSPAPFLLHHDRQI